jgi:hypothetical protein
MKKYISTILASLFIFSLITGGVYAERRTDLTWKTSGTNAILNDPGVTQVCDSTEADCLLLSGSGLTNTVISVFSRTGAVTATDGDYSQSLITGLKTTDAPTFAGATLTGNMTGTTIVNSGDIKGLSFTVGANTLNTTEWAFLDGQDQSVLTTSAPTFSGATITNNLDVGGSLSAGSLSIDGAVSGDIQYYNPVNDANPQIRVGSADANELHIQSVFDSGTQTLDYALFSTDSAGSGNIVLNPSGNVGVGTTAPGSNLPSGSSSPTVLEVSKPNGDTTFSLRSTTDGARGADFWTDYDTADFYIDNRWTGANGRIRFRQNTDGTPADVLTIDNSGNVGVGTASPGQSLDVWSTASIADDNGSGPATSLRLMDKTSSAEGVGGGLLFSGYHDGTSSRAGFSSIKGFKENGTAANFAGAMAFYTRANGASQTEQMRISSAGNVGVGTASPLSALHIVNSNFDVMRLADNETDDTDKYSEILHSQYDSGTETEASLGVGFGATTSTNSVYMGGGFSDRNAATDLHFFTAANNTTRTGTERMTIDNAGQVGIGDTSPDFLLDVNGVTRSAGLLRADVGITLGGSQTINSSAGTISISPATNLVLTPSSGNVGIGEASPSQLLEVKSSESGGGGAGQILLSSSDATERGIAMGMGGSSTVFMGSVTDHRVDITQAGSPIITILTNDNVGIGETAPDSKLEVNGTIHATNLDGGAVNLTANASGQIIRDPSDERLKEDIKDFDGALDKLMLLQGREYRWIEEAGMGDNVEYGLIAQEVYEVDEKLAVISEGESFYDDFEIENLMGLNSRALFAVIIESVKEVNLENQQQEEKIQDLEERIEYLEQLILSNG